MVGITRRFLQLNCKIHLEMWIGSYLGKVGSCSKVLGILGGATNARGVDGTTVYQSMLKLSQKLMEDGVSGCLQCLLVSWFADHLQG